MTHTPAQLRLLHAAARRLRASDGLVALAIATAAAPASMGEIEPAQKLAKTLTALTT